MGRTLIVAVGCVLVSFCGCAGYRLGPTSGVMAGARSIQIVPFQNQTAEPRLIEPITIALRKSLQQDGTYRLETRHGGDIIVTGILTGYDREGISFEPRDVVTVRDFRVTLRAKVTAVERSTGKTMLDREVIGRTTLRMGADLASAERQAAPLLADDLARNITALLVDGTW